MLKNVGRTAGWHSAPKMENECKNVNFFISVFQSTGHFRITFFNLQAFSAIFNFERTIFMISKICLHPISDYRLLVFYLLSSADDDLHVVTKGREKSGAILMNFFSGTWWLNLIYLSQKYLGISPLNNVWDLFLVKFCFVWNYTIFEFATIIHFAYILK